MTISPDLHKLPYKEIKGVKYFELIAEEVERELLPGLFIKAWGYNGSTPGPTIEVLPGDYVNFRVYNRLSQATSVHWHGLDVPNTMDGVPEVEPSPKIEPGYYFDYKFKIINPPGTHMYHSHHISHEQEMRGMEGGLIILDPYDMSINKDYFIMLQEFKVEGIPMGVIKTGNYEIDPHSHDFNFFTMNGKCFPFTTPLEVNCYDKVRIRLANAMHDTHPIHIHGHQFMVSAADGNTINPSHRMKRNTIQVASGEIFDVEFYANNPGIWPFHCHIPHHMTNNMTEPTGGMFTTIKYI